MGKLIMIIIFSLLLSFVIVGGIMFFISGSNQQMTVMEYAASFLPPSIEEAMFFYEASDPTDNQDIVQEPSYSHMKLIDDDMVLYYPMDYNTSLPATDLVRDYSINNHDGIKKGFTSNYSSIPTGYIGGFAGFDGDDNEIVIPATATLNVGTGGWSWAAWMVVGNGDQLAGFAGANIVGGNEETWAITISNPTIDGAGQTFGAVFQSDTGGDWRIAVASDDVFDNTLHHYAAVLDRTGTDTVQLYVDGVAIAQTPIYAGTLGDIDTSSVQTQIGVASSVYAEATIDEVMFWNRTLSAYEIGTIYNITLARFPSIARQNFTVENYTDLSSDNRVNLTIKSSNTTYWNDSSIYARVWESNDNSTFRESPNGEILFTQFNTTHMIANDFNVTGGAYTYIYPEIIFKSGGFYSPTLTNINLTTYEVASGDITAPFFTTIPNNVTADYIVANVNADFNADDAIGFGGFYLNDTTNFSIDYGTGALTNNSPMTARRYEINVTINDTSLNINWTPFVVTVNQIIPEGSLAGTSPIVYDAVGDVEGSESNSGDGGVGYTLFRNGTSVSNPDAITLAVGYYGYIWNASAGVNYTANASMDTFFLTVTQNLTDCQILFNETSPLEFPKTFIPIADCTSAYTLSLNGSSITNGTEQINGAGAFNFTVQRTDTENYSNIFDEDELIVSPIIPEGSLAGTTPIQVGTAGDVTSSESQSWDSDVNYTMFRNDSFYPSPDTEVLAVGFYGYLLNTTGGANYTSNSSMDTFSLTVVNYTTAINITFTNTTHMDIAKGVFNEGENFFFWWNWTNSNDTALTDDNGICNFTGRNIIFENESDIATPFTLCDTLACDETNPLEESFTMEASNVTENITRDFVRLEICHVINIGNDLNVQFDCQGATDTVTVSQADFGLCSGGFSEVFVESGACMNSTTINITLDNNAPPGFRHNIDEWEFDRETQNHTDSSLGGAVSYNSTAGLWMSDDNYEQYEHGTISVEVNCTHNTQPLFNMNASNTATIFNKAPIIADGQVRPLITNTTYNLTETIPPIIEYEYGNWTWVVPLIDDDIQFHNETWRNSTNNIINFIEEFNSESVHNTTNGNFSELGTFNLTVWVNDTVGNFTQKVFNFSVVDTTAPQFITIPNNVSEDYLVANVNADFDASDWLAVSGFTINDTDDFTMNFATGVLTNNSPLSAGGYALNVSINDTENNINWTIFTVIVSAISPVGTVTANTPIIYNALANVSGNESNSGDSDVVYNLSRNGTFISTTDNSILAVGFYTYVWNSTVGANYTANSSLVNFNLTINQNETQCGIQFNETSPIESPKTFLVWSNCTSGFVLSRNETIIVNSSEQTLVVSAYNFSVQRNDTANYSNVYADREFIVSAEIDVNHPYFTFIPNNVTGDYLVANVNVFFNYTDNFNISMIFINDTSLFTMDNNTATLTNNSPLSAGGYALNVTINDTANLINWTIFTVIVSPIAPSGTISGSTPITFGTAGDVQGLETNGGDGDVGYTLFRNDSSASNPDTLTLGVGFYTYVWNASAGTNYTANVSMFNFNLTVTDGGSPCDVLFNTTSPINFPETFSVWSNCDSTFVLTRNGTTITNNTEQELAVSAYNFSVQRTDVTNYSNTFDDEEFSISVGIGVVFTYLDNKRQNLSIDGNKTAYLNATLNVGSGNVTLYYNDSLINQGGSDLANLTNFTDAGTFNVTAFYGGNVNFSSDFETWYVIVSVPTRVLTPSCSLSVLYDDVSIPVLRRWRC